MNDKIYWIWLQQSLGINPTIRTDEIVSYFGSAKSLYFAGEMEWRLSGIFTPKQISKLCNQDLSKAENILTVCAKNNWQVVTPGDGNYPSMLFKLPNFPLVLYVNGDLDCLKNKITIALVGTREPTVNSSCAARSLAASLTRSGAVVISGGALGIDSASHQGALDANGKTVAVLGCGLDCNYPVANQAMRKQISQNGAVVTEYPPGTMALARNFPIRNRIISGLSYGTLVIEAGERSGSLITANYALEQGRDVFAVPGDILFSGFTGANKLIRDGAKPVFNALDVLEDYAIRYPDLIKTEQIETTLTLQEQQSRPVEKTQVKVAEKTVEKSIVRKPEPSGLSEDARKIYRAFDRSEMQKEELIMKTGLGVSAFACAMTELELYGVVELLAGKNYKLK
ncbi:MAG: DNA-processing protein DprA [Acutalibacteraceae bacterium]|nr:DNA-processing protein DprA [Acutalibacteraceae bacterium]